MDDVSNPLQRATQTDLEAANSAKPDTDRLPAWNDTGWDEYLWATDPVYRQEWYAAHGYDEAAPDEDGEE